MMAIIVIMCSLNIVTSLAVLYFLYDNVGFKGGYKGGYKLGLDRGRKIGDTEGYLRGMRAFTDYLKTEKEAKS